MTVLTLRSLLAAVCLVGGFATATAAASTSPDYLGVNTQPLFKDAAIPQARWSSFLDQLRAGRMTVSRLDVNWKSVEKTAPVGGAHSYNWNDPAGAGNSIDAMMYELAAHGVRAQPTFTALPSWVRAPARPGETWFSDFADFVAAYAVRYGPGGQFWAEHPALPVLPPVDFEIWNEANSPNSWTGKADAPAYARMLNVVYPRVKEAAPSVRLYASIGWPEAAGYLDGIWAAGAGSSLDGIAFHPYSPTAMAIVKLVVGLRTKLRQLGRGDIPIAITETGQPVTYTGPGAAHAYDGGVSDSARAATQAFTADVLARSDCNVNQFLVYAITGTETSKEILSEGFMGVLRYADASPNVTGQALQRASKRWAQGLADGTALKAGRIALCSTTATPAPALLPLDVSGVRSTDGCVRGTVGYDGNPLEGSTLVLTTEDGRRNETAPDAYGHSDVCVPDGPPISSVKVFAEVPNSARSATLQCDIPVKSCFTITPPPSAAVQATVGGGSSTCGVIVTAKRPRLLSARSVRSKVLVKAKLQCGAVPKGAKYRFLVTSKKPRGKKETKLRSVTLRNGRTVRFTVTPKVKKGDLVVLLHRASSASTTDRLIRIRQSVALATPRR